MKRNNSFISNILCCLLMIILIGCKNSTTEDEIDNTVNQNNNSAKWVKIKTDYWGTLALKNDGTLWSWGSSYAGIGILQESLIPIKVLDNVIDFTFGEGKTTLAIKNNGTLWGAGQNTYSITPIFCNSTQQNFYYHMFGASNLTDRQQFQQIESNADWDKFIDNESFFGQLLKKKDNMTYGIGSLSSPDSYVWGNVGCGNQWYIPTNSIINQYTKISNYNWRDISLNDIRIAIKEDGTLWYWKTSSTQSIDPRIPIQFGNESDWKSIINKNTIIKNDGSIWKLAHNQNNTNFDLISTKIGTDNWKVFSSTSYTERNFGIKNDGTLWGWGINSDGFLGTGNYINSTSPTKLSLETNWEYIYTDGYTTFAINAKGQAWGWGKNNYGQLGDGTKVDKYTLTLLQKPN